MPEKRVWQLMKSQPLLGRRGMDAELVQCGLSLYIHKHEDGESSVRRVLYPLT
jgi:hypothetical protein